MEHAVIEHVSKSNMLGVYIADDLTCDVHITEIHKRAGQKLYFLILLRTSVVSAEDLQLYEIFTYRIRPIVEYTLPSIAYQAH